MKTAMKSISSEKKGKGRTVLVTGAGAGIGREIARLFYGAGYDILAVSLVKDELESLEDELRCAGGPGLVDILPMDLSQTGTAQMVLSWCDGLNRTVDILVNNAGFGLMAEHVSISGQRLHEMLMLNMVTVTELCRLFGARMKERRFGRILNVASTISFQPLPCLAAYTGTKAYISFFTQSLAGELGPHGVTVSCLYPGTTRTAFLDSAGITRDEKGGGMGSAIHSVAMDPAKVARAAFKGVISGRRRIIPGLSNRLHFLFIHWIPDRLIVFTVWLFMKGMAARADRSGRSN